MLKRNNKMRLFLRIINNQNKYLQKCDVSIKETFKKPHAKSQPKCSPMV